MIVKEEQVYNNASGLHENLTDSCLKVIVTNATYDTFCMIYFNLLLSISK